MELRATQRVIFFLALTSCLLLPVEEGKAAKSLRPPHDSSNSIDCRSCHAIVPAFIPLRERQETVCKSCHNPTGQAASLTHVNSHRVEGGTRLVDCGSCHDPHRPFNWRDPHTGLSLPNLSLIRGDTAKYVPAALEPAIFHARPDNFAFGESDPPWNGICQTCHTGTNHHTNNASADHTHQFGDDCTSCHVHQAGFMPQGGGDCTGCHSGPQDNGDGVPPGGRRAVVGEFPEGSVHAHYGAELNEDACLVCHSIDTHQNGYVELIDADDGTLYSFVNPEDLASDPDLSTFCASCHDADGAQRLPTPLDPFGNGNTPPDVHSRFLGTLQWDEWYGDFCFGNEGTLRQVNSHHDINDGDQAWSGAKIECLNCHGAHNVSAGAALVNPFDTSTIWTFSENEFCLSCHDGGLGPSDPDFPSDVVGPTVPLRGLDTCDYNVMPWFVDYTYTYSPHGLDSKRDWTGYSGAPAYEVGCTVCHDPHGSYTPTNPLGNPYMIKDFVDGQDFVDDGNHPQGFNGPPWNLFGMSAPVEIPINGVVVGWQNLCGVCHSTWLQAYDWHAYCDGCQTCHGHGQAWNGNDWGPEPNDSISCASGGGSGASTGGLQGQMSVPGDPMFPPLHLMEP